MGCHIWSILHARDPSWCTHLDWEVGSWKAPPYSGVTNNHLESLNKFAHCIQWCQYSYAHTNPSICIVKAGLCIDHSIGTETEVLMLPFLSSKMDLCMWNWAWIGMFFTFGVVKDLEDWKEAPLESLILSLYQLQAFYMNETKRGLAGLGNYLFQKSESLNQKSGYQHQS